MIFKVVFYQIYQLVLAFVYGIKDGHKWIHRSIRVDYYYYFITWWKFFVHSISSTFLLDLLNCYPYFFPFNISKDFCEVIEVIVCFVEHPECVDGVFDHLYYSFNHNWFFWFSHLPTSVGRTHGESHSVPRIDSPG